MFTDKKFIIVLFIFFSAFANFSYAETLKFDTSTYEGDVKKGKANGKGIFTFSDGSKYEGKFKKNKIHGKGKYTDANGKIYEGKWKHGKFKNKIDKKTREIIILNFLTGKSANFEIRGKGNVADQWFEAEKNSSGTYALTAKGEKDMKKSIEKAASGGPDDSSGGGACGG